MEASQPAGEPPPGSVFANWITAVNNKASQAELEKAAKELLARFTRIKAKELGGRQTLRRSDGAAQFVLGRSGES